MNIYIKINQTFIILLALTVFGLLSACSNPAPAANPPKEPLAPPDRVDVVYFYNSQICKCQAAPGEHIYGTLFINFSGEMGSGKLTFQSIDLNDNNNAAMVHKYGATPISLFVNVVRADTEHIIAIPEILLVQDDNEALDRLVTTRIRGYLDGEE